MNRTIKFRGKCTFCGEWICGYLVVVPHGAHRIYFKPFDDATSNTWLEVDPSTVGQFTGPLDKDGKEIYEGDIFSCFQGDKNTVIWYCDSWCYANYHACALPLGELGNPYQNEGRLNCEIIGNIYENPELL